MERPKLDHWTDLYGSRFFDWHSLKVGSRNLYYRRQGIVENSFDIDGTDFEGRADLNVRLTVELHSSLSDQDLRERIILIWALLRHRHILLSSKSLQAREFLPGSNGDCWLDKCFVYDVPSTKQIAIDDGKQTCSFVKDSYPEVDSDDFYLHVLNASRAFDEKRQLARFFVLPTKHTTQGTLKQEFLIVIAHQIVDGLAAFRWSNDIVDLLNRSHGDLVRELDKMCHFDSVPTRLPAAQESLYPPVATNKPMWRWKWLISRILRHVRRAPPAAFQNPLQRHRPCADAFQLLPTYLDLLNYDRKPPLSCYYNNLIISKRASANLRSLCRQAGISLGSGYFTLVGLVMMRLEERRCPHVRLENRLPFVSSFPINPRPFLAGPSTVGKEDSLTLSFSDGIALPFLPSYCDLEKSFRVLGRLAHRQLSQYQKRKRTPEEELVLGSRSPEQIIRTTYLSSLERAEAMAPPERRYGFDAQGKFPASNRGSRATCGISSVGDRTKLISAGRYNIKDLKHQDLAAEFAGHSNCVRARDGEMLIGPGGIGDQQIVLTSFDATNLDPVRVKEWEAMLRNLLDYDMQGQSPQSKL